MEEFCTCAGESNIHCKILLFMNGDFSFSNSLFILFIIFFIILLCFSLLSLFDYVLVWSD